MERKGGARGEDVREKKRQKAGAEIGSVSLSPWILKFNVEYNSMGQIFSHLVEIIRVCKCAL